MGQAGHGPSHFQISRGPCRKDSFVHLDKIWRKWALYSKTTSWRASLGILKSMSAVGEIGDRGYRVDPGST